MVASALAGAFEARGAEVVIVKEPAADLSDLPHLAVAVLDGRSLELCRRLEVRRVPFVLYTARTEAPTVEKPAAMADIVARVEQLMAR